jgi:hypothetical protein
MRTTNSTTLPFGDLCARREDLLAACDEVVPVSRAVTIPNVPAGARVGVITSMARPERLRSALGDLDVRVFIERPDHAPLRDPSIFDRKGVDVWLIDQKTHVRLAGRRHALVIEHRVSLSDDLLARLVLTSRAA